MFKPIYLSFIVIFSLFFTACTSSKINTIDNFIDTNSQKRIYTNDSCTFDSYILNSTYNEYGNIFIEQVNLNSNCEWNGFQRSYFDNLFKEKTASKNVLVLERIDFEGYEFSTYLINDKYIMNLIYKFLGNENKFIIDYKGKLFTRMIRQFDKSYENKYLNKPRFSSKYNSSLVRQNIIKHYFNEEIEPFD